MDERANARDDVERLARAAVARVADTAARALRLLRGVVVVAALCGVVAFALGWWASDDPWPTYAIVAVPITAAPTVIAAFALGRVQAVVDGAPTLVADLRTAAADPGVRRRLSTLAQRSPAGGRGWRRARDLWRLRRDVLGPHVRSLELWASVLALARLPWILAATALGCAVLALWSLVALVALAV